MRVELSAFQYCNSLTNVYYEGDIETWCGIYFYAQSGYIGNMLASHLHINNQLVTEIEIPDTVTVIPQFAFWGTGTRIIIPDSIIKIEDHAFDNNYVEIIYNGTMEQWNAITKSELWGYYAQGYTVHCSDGDIIK